MQTVSRNHELATPLQKSWTSCYNKKYTETTYIADNADTLRQLSLVWDLYTQYQVYTASVLRFVVLKTITVNSLHLHGYSFVVLVLRLIPAPPSCLTSL